MNDKVLAGLVADLGRIAEDINDRIVDLETIHHHWTHMEAEALAGKRATEAGLRLLRASLESVDGLVELFRLKCEEDPDGSADG